MDGVGEEYEWPKKWRGRWVVQLLSASCRIPVGLGNVVIHLYISVACGHDGGKESGIVGLVPKRKWQRIGPRRPKGSIAKGMSVMLLCKNVADDCITRDGGASGGVAFVATVELLFF
jgi:hypothetical protein